MEKYNTDIVGLQETKKAGRGMKEVGNYIFFNSGNEERRLGTGFMVHKKYKSAVMDFAERLCLLRMRTRFRNVLILNVHAPTEVAEADPKKVFMTRWRKYLAKFQGVI